MEILIYDTESTNQDIYDIVAKHLNINFIKTTTEEDFYLHYKKISKDSLIIIDVTNEIGEKLFQHITNTVPKQKILVISKTLTYNHTFTCKQCADIFDRKLLLKPINVHHLILYIQNFDKLLCKYSSDSNEISVIMHDIFKQFISYSFNRETKEIILNDTSSNHIKELISITDLLKTHNIRYEIQEKNIKLHF
mgnify:CR=1 FL=1